jgi:dienelactone hydrolase
MQRKLTNPTRNVVARVLLWLIGTLFVLVFILIVSLEIWHNAPFQLPKHTGSSAVGHTMYWWSDTTRTDPLSPKKDRQRELMVSIWYPAMPHADSKPAPYLPEYWARVSEQEAGIMGILKRQTNAIRTNATENSSLAPALHGYPVIVFVPGLGPIASDYTILAEDIASQGYVVVAPTMTYSAQMVVFPDGHVARSTPAGNPPDDTAPTELDQLLGSSVLLETWVADIRFVLDQLKVLNTTASGRFAQQLELEHIGIIGHSYGGATAAETCHLDSRCKVVVNMDGWLYGTIVKQGLQQPFMFISSETLSCDVPCEQAQHRLQNLYRHSKYGSVQLTIKGALHFNFTDIALLMLPQATRSMGLIGSSDPQRVLRLTSDYLMAFLNLHLKGQPSSLLGGSNRTSSEVIFEQK